jgi:hypothetical protein
MVPDLGGQGLECAPQLAFARWRSEHRPAIEKRRHAHRLRWSIERDESGLLLACG